MAALLLALLPGCATPAGTEATALLGEIASALPQVTAASRDVLLGERDPNGPTCFRYREVGSTDAGYKPPPPGNLQGGPGNHFLQMYYWDHKVASPTADYAWHQGPLRRALEAMRRRSANASAGIAPLEARARRLAQLLAGQSTWPAGLRPAGGGSEANWPEACLAALEEAVARKDLAAAGRWADELAAALFALGDLHRWLEFITANQLANLDFQVLGESLFADREAEYEKDYFAPAIISRFPGGSLGVTALNNYFEIERQAEGLFRDPAELREAAASSEAARGVSAAFWMPPDMREGFIQLRDRLSPANRAVWDRAAGMPYERSFMVSNLSKPLRAGVLDRLGTVLERFDKLHPAASVDELMDILPYRAGLGMAGYEWADRFDGRLMDAAAGLADGGDRREALLAAHRFAYGVYGGQANYQSLVLSLRLALDTGKYDCIRGTDMVAAVYRNAGRPGFLNVRWCRGSSGHTIAGVAVEGGERNGATSEAGGAAGAGPRVVTVDSLFAPERAEGAYPDSYFTGHRDVYCVELNGRGLDNYVWLEGYVGRGPNAGMLLRAAVPYLPGREEASSRKVHWEPAAGAE